MKELPKHDLQTTGVTISNSSPKALKKKKSTVEKVFLALLISMVRGIPEQFVALNEFNIAISLGLLTPFAVHQVLFSFTTFLMIGHQCL